MSPKTNKAKSNYLSSLAGKINILKNSAQNIVFNFKFFCFGKNGGQSFEEWEHEKILADLNNKLKNFSGKTIDELRSDGTLEIYDSYPKSSKFTCPSALVITNAIWCRLRLTGRRRLIGFLSPDEPKKTFYVVFLDKNHEFAPANKN